MLRILALCFFTHSISLRKCRFWARSWCILPAKTLR